MESSFSIFKNNKWIKFVLVIVFLQQALVAAGTFFLGLLSSEYPSEGFKITTALMLFICILLPGTIVHYGIALCTARANKLAQCNYITRYMDSNFNHPMHLRNEKSKHQRHDIMCRGGQEAIHTAVNFFIDLTATWLNIVLNTVAIILVTDLTLGAIIVLAGIFGLGIIHFSEKGISETSRNEMLADNQINAHLSCSWDNIIIGNELFFNRWKEQFKKYFVTSEIAALEAVKKRDWAIFAAGLVTNGIVIGAALGLAWFYSNYASFVLAILVMLPRCLQIVIHIQVIQTYFAQWKSLKEKLAVTQESLSKPQAIDLSSFIQQDEISIKLNNKNIPAKTIENLLKESSFGRFTITGPNGIGKSSLLLKLKSTLNSSAIYLPAQHQFILRECRLNLSSGEIALTALKDLQSEKSSILLLDEWDANLSAKNRSELDQIIDQISLNQVVVEVRHNISGSR